MSLAQVEDEKKAKENHIKMLNEDLASQDEVIAKLSKEKASLEETNQVMKTRRGTSTQQVLQDNFQNMCIWIMKQQHLYILITDVIVYDQKSYTLSIQESP